MTDKALLREVAQTLNRWAWQSETGGWSTHQTGGQRELAARIYQHLGAPDAEKDVKEPTS